MDDHRKNQDSLYKPDHIRTFTGIYLDVNNPQQDMINIVDIAHALSQIPRFCGHTKEYYSVAQHCYMGIPLVSEGNQLAFLLHDATEAYLMDIPSPVKKGLPDYRRKEDRFMRVIFKKYGLSYPLADEIKKADKEMLEFEWRHLMMGEPYPEGFTCWTPAFAKEVFLKAFEKLMKK